MKDFQDTRPVEAILWTEEVYLEVFRRAGLTVLGKYTLMAKEDEPYQWIDH